MNNLFRFLFGIVLLISITSCGTDPEPGSKEHITKVTNQIDENRLLTADESPGDWLSYGKNYKEDRFSTLGQITKSNIDSLGLAWSINLGT